MIIYFLALLLGVQMNWSPLALLGMLVTILGAAMFSTVSLYEVDALRALMLAHGTSTFGLALDLSFLLVATVIAVIIGARFIQESSCGVR